ncbi:MAG: chemotaxis protein CheD [Spirochaetes bacterium]|nr:chemotaxis protein CheD [Spirochaetota bacterium]
MRIKYSTKHKLEMVVLFPGEYHATGYPKMISTLLGSCVAVALFDERKQVAGLNHFMLPQRLSNSQKFFLSDAGKYGMYAMELLINEMIKIGALKENLKAKVFGGAKVLNFPDKRTINISDSNVEFAFGYLQEEGIPVISSDTGGSRARHVLFFTEDAKVLLRRIAGRDSDSIEENEQKYFDKIKITDKIKEKLTFF